MSAPAPVVWQPRHAEPPPPWGLPPLGAALRRGIAGHCPACGKGRLFRGFLRPATECTACGAPLARLRADDLPPYLTIFIVGHIVGPSMLMLERAAAPAIWFQVALWVPLSLGLTLGLMRPVKGAVMGLMLHLGQPKVEADA